MRQSLARTAETDDAAGMRQSHARTAQIQIMLQNGDTMKRAMSKLNNTGATLILVIVSLLFVGIIAAVILTLTTGNVTNLFTASRSTDNFYSAEEAMDEIRTSLQEYADEAARKAYTEWLQNYSYLFADGSTESVDELFKNKFKSNLEEILEDVLFRSDGADGTTLIDIDDLLDTPEGAVKWFDTGSTAIVTEDDRIVIKDLSIEYTDDDGYKSIITTDIVFDITYPGFAANKVNYETLPCSTYAIIADRQITNNGTNPITITGNLYGGGLNGTSYTGNGLYFTNGSNVSIKGDYLLSRSTILLEDNASVTIAGPYATGSRSYSSVWAKNIDLAAAIAKGSPTMKITGDCYISDDLTLDADGSSFTMTAGSSFYAYNTTNAKAGDTDEFGVTSRTGTPEGSSAIVINGKNSTIDMSNASNVWIAGKTFITVPSYASGTSEATTEEVTATFIQGESVSYRALQAAYLLPGECVVGIGHNPMTYTEYAKILKSSKDSSLSVKPALYMNEAMVLTPLNSPKYWQSSSAR